MNALRSLAIALLLQSIASAVLAQAASPAGGTDRSVWLSYFGDHPVTDLWAVHIEGSYRRTLGLSQLEQLELRPGVTLQETPRDQSLVAYSFFRSSPTADGTFGPAPLDDRQIENRLFEQHQLTTRVGRRFEAAPQVIQRVRLEQRWQSTGIHGGGYSSFAFSERARYRLTAIVPFGSSGMPKHYLTAFNEVYVNAFSHTPLFNQDVTYAAFGTRFHRYWAIELGYQFRDAAADAGVTSDRDHSVQLYLISTAPFRHFTK